MDGSDPVRLGERAALILRDGNERRVGKATDELGHLPLSSARFESRKEDRDRNLWREIHTAHLSKHGATLPV